MRQQAFFGNKFFMTAMRQQDFLGYNFQRIFSVEEGKFARRKIKTKSCKKYIAIIYWEQGGVGNCGEKFSLQLLFKLKTQSRNFGKKKKKFKKKGLEETFKYKHIVNNIIEQFFVKNVRSHLSDLT